MELSEQGIDLEEQVAPAAPLETPARPLRSPVGAPLWFCFHTEHKFFLDLGALTKLHPHTLRGRPVSVFAFSSFYFYTFFCIKKKSIITTNYKGLKQD